MKHKYIRFIFFFWFLLMTITSLTPFGFDKNSYCLYDSSRFTVFSVAFGIIFIIFYPVCSLMLIDNFDKSYGYLITIAGCIEYVLGYCFLINLIILQIVNRKKIQTLFNENWKLIKLIKKIFNNKSLFDFIKIKRFLIYFLLKSVVFESGLLFVTWFVLNFHMKNLSVALLISSLYTLLPTLGLTIISNIFYGQMIFIIYCYNLVNNRLKIMIKSINNTNRRVLDMQLQLSDAIDELCLLHSKLNEFVNRLITLYSTQLLIIIGHNFIIIIIQLFFTYVTVSSAMWLNISFSYEYVICGLVYTGINFIEVFFIVDACSTVVAQVNFSYFLVYLIFQHFLCV